jgi:hypothetical protein
MFTFNWGVFWAILAAFAVRGLFRKFLCWPFRDEEIVDILRTGQGWLVRRRF